MQNLLNSILTIQILAYVLMFGGIGYSFYKMKQLIDAVCHEYDFVEKSLEESTKIWAKRYKEYKQLPAENKKVLYIRLSLRIRFYKILVPIISGAVSVLGGVSIFISVFNYIKVTSWLTTDIMVFAISYVGGSIIKIVRDDIIFWNLIKNQINE